MVRTAKQDAALIRLATLQGGTLTANRVVEKTVARFQRIVSATYAAEQGSSHAHNKVNILKSTPSKKHHDSS